MTTPRRASADAADRDRIRTDLAHSYVVEAAAGTGKTTELVARIISVLASGHAGATIDKIVAVTFTEKAAGELKLRLREELEAARQREIGDRRDRLEQSLRYLEEARVSTIHGFCADLLRERPVEARIDPQFQVLTEDQASRLYDLAFEAWLQEQLGDPGDGVRRSLRRPARRNFGADIDEDGPVERLRRAGKALLEWRDHPARWRTDPFDREGEIRQLVMRLADFAPMSSGPAWDKDVLYLDTTRARTGAAAIADGLVPADDLDGLEALLVDLHHDRGFAKPRKGSGAAYSKLHTRAAVWDRRQELYAALGEFERRANADLAAALQQDLRASLERYEALKAAEGALDFVDLLLRARDLLRDDAEVRRTFRERLSHLFVDEFQDTDPLQAEIVVLLAGAPDADRVSPVDWREVEPRPGSLFIVGDPKQSIYRFRRADIGTYRVVCDWLRQRNAKQATLTTSFRATPAIQRFVNAAFAPLMTDDAVTQQPPYVRLTPSRDDHTSQPAVVALPVPRPYGARNVTKGAIEKSLPDAVGAFLKWLFDKSGWTVTERSLATGKPEQVAIRPRHVCLLFRRFTSFNQDVTRPYVQALEARDIAHLLVGGKSFHDREEVETIRAALTSVEWPDDELSVFATLRGALFAIGDDSLLEYRHHFSRFHPYQVPQNLGGTPAAGGRCAHAAPRVAPAAQTRPVADTLNDLLIATRAHVAFALRPGGEQALANVLHVADLARRYEAEGGLSFRGFVTCSWRGRRPGRGARGADPRGRKRRRAHDDRPQGQGARVPGRGAGGSHVQVVARHRRSSSRRLARPLCRAPGGVGAGRSARPRAARGRARSSRGPAAGLRRRNARARPAGGARRRRRAVHRWVGESAERGHLPELQPASRSRDWHGVAVVQTRQRAGATQRRPGACRDRAAWVAPVQRGHRRALQRRLVGPRGSRARPAPADGRAAREPDRQGRLTRRGGGDARGLPTWETGRASAIAAASRPSLVVTTASEWAAGERELPDRAPLPDIAVHVVGDRLEDGRPSGTRFGALVHAVLAGVALDADVSAVETTARTQARLLGATADDEMAAVEPRAACWPRRGSGARRPRRCAGASCP